MIRKPKDKPDKPPGKPQPPITPPVPAVTSSIMDWLGPLSSAAKTAVARSTQATTFAVPYSVGVAPPIVIPPPVVEPPIVIPPPVGSKVPSIALVYDAGGSFVRHVYYQISVNPLRPGR